MANRLPSGRWRGRVRDPRTGKQIAPHTIIGGASTYATRRAAERAEDDARDELHELAMTGVTVAEWRQTWLTDPAQLIKRDGTMKQESTVIHNEERTRAFTAIYGDWPLRAIDDRVVDSYIADPTNWSQVPKLSVMFGAAMDRRAGRLIDRNPWANLGLPRSRGRTETDPPTPDKMAELLRLADELCPPSFAAYMHTAVYSAMRPGELDALRWEDLDFTPGAETINVRWKWCPTTHRINEPKNDSTGPVVMFAPLRDRLLAWKRVCPSSEWVFPTAANSRSKLGHFTPSTRSHHWRPLRVAAGIPQVQLYEATRHYAGWYLTNIAELPPEVCATQFRHKDRGKTFRATYSHPDRARNLERIRAAVAGLAPVVALPASHAVSHDQAQRTA